MVNCNAKKAPRWELRCFSSFEKIEMYNQNHTLDNLYYSFVQQKGKKIIFLQKKKIYYDTQILRFLYALPFC